MHRPAPPPSRPILLVGLPGAGKTTLAPLLAEALGLRSYDSDALVVAEAKRSIAEIFRAEGEAGFRGRERTVLEGLLRGAPSVIASGGGALLDPELRALAETAATMVWLDADVERLAARLGEASDRPLLAGNVRARLAELKSERDPLYARAPIHVDAEQAPGAVAAAILGALSEPVR